MSFRDRFKQKKSSLSRQHNSQTQSKDKKGNFPTIILKNKLPAGMEIWKCNEAKHLIEIIPFFAGPDFPIDIETNEPLVAEGDAAYVLDLEVHQNVGSLKTPYVCPRKNFGLPCPICEFMDENELETEDWKKLNTKRRVVYLIWVLDSRETMKKGLQIWEIAHFTMEANLNEIAALPKGGGAISFADPDTGKSIAFTRKGSGRNNTQYLGHRFVDRENKIPDSLLDRAEKIQLDQLVKMHPTYEEIEEAFKGQRAKIGVNSDDDSGESMFDDPDNIPDFMKEHDNEEKQPKEEKKPAAKKFVIKRKK